LGWQADIVNPLDLNISLCIILRKSRENKGRKKEESKLDNLDIKGITMVFIYQ